MNLPRLPIVVAVIALAAAAVTFFLTGNLLSPSIDEGIYIQGAHRIASGQVPYRDFFAFAGPITYWIEAAVEILAGRSVPAMRLAIALSVGMIAAGIVSVVQSFAGLRAGLSIAVLWFGITIDLWNRLEVNHRWISMGFYSAALICLFIGDRNIGKVRAFCAGAALALACWTTQSFAWPLSILAVYFFFAIRNRLPAFLLGAA